MFHFHVLYQFCLAHFSSIWIRVDPMTLLQFLVIVLAQFDLVKFLCEYIVCFTLETLLRFQYCFIFLQTSFVITEFYFAFYYALVCAMCSSQHSYHLSHNYTFLVTTRQTLSLLFHLIHNSLVLSLFCFCLWAVVNFLINLIV